MEGRREATLNPKRQKKKLCVRTCALRRCVRVLYVCDLHTISSKNNKGKKRGVQFEAFRYVRVCSSLWAQQPATELCNICNSSQVRAHLYAIKVLLRRVSSLRPRCCARPIKALLRRVSSLRPRCCVRPSATIAVRQPTCNTPATRVRHSISWGAPPPSAGARGGGQASASAA